MAIDEGPRKELVFEWTATYNDDTELKQYNDEKDEEHHFGHIDQSKLSKLSLTSKRSKDVFTLDLETGLFYMNLKKLDVGMNYSGKEVKVKPILFRRIQRILRPGVKGPDLKEVGVKVVYFLGWEGTVDGEKEKHGLQIFEDSTFAIPPQDSFHAH